VNMAFFLNNFLVIGEIVAGTATMAVCLLAVVAVKQKRRTGSIR